MVQCACNPHAQRPIDPLMMMCDTHGVPSLMHCVTLVDCF